MKNNSKIWLSYAIENIQGAKIVLESKLFNLCLQNCQQGAEKLLKSLLINNEIAIQKTHSIMELVNLLRQHNISINIDPDDIDLLDSIYLPSKYPLESALPSYYPTENICQKCIEIVDSLKSEIEAQLL